MVSHTPLSWILLVAILSKMLTLGKTILQNRSVKHVVRTGPNESFCKSGDPDDSEHCPFLSFLSWIPFFAIFSIFLTKGKTTLQEVQKVLHMKDFVKVVSQPPLLTLPFLLDCKYYGHKCWNVVKKKKKKNKRFCKSSDPHGCEHFHFFLGSCCSPFWHVVNENDLFLQIL